MRRFSVAVAVILCLFGALWPISARCSDEQAAFPFMDTRLPVEKRVADLVSRLTLEEKAALMNDESEAVPRLGIKHYRYWNEALHGVARSGKFTVFPMAIGFGASWDPELVEKIATAISDEAWGANNRDAKTSGYPPQRFLTFWSPTINMARDPRWGRTPETYGEDPVLTSRLAVAFVKGLQGSDGKYLKVAATPKHFAANNEEHRRTGGSATVSMKALREYYFPAFKATVVEGRAQSVMGAYNAINGVPCNADKWLLTDVLRKEWGFDGFVTTDCGAMAFMTTDHHYSKDGAEAAAYAINAGVNTECGGEHVIRNNLAEAVRRGLVTEKRIDESVAELLTNRFKLGMFDPPEMNPYTKISPDVIGSKEHIALARRTEQEAIILLKNGGGKSRILPLNKKKIRTIAVVGPYGDKLEYGEYSGDPAGVPVTLLDGIRGKAGAKIKVIGVPWIPVPGQEDFSTADVPGGFKLEFFNGVAASGAAAVSRADVLPILKKNDVPPEVLKQKEWTARWSAKFTAGSDGAHLFLAEGSGKVRLTVGGKTVIDFSETSGDGSKTELKSGAALSMGSFKGNAKTPSRRAVVFMQKGRVYDIVLEYTPAGKKTAARLGLIAPKGDAAAARKAEMDAIKSADVVIMGMGYVIDDEREGMDRSSLSLPNEQETYILGAAELNRNTVLVLTNGSPVGIGEIDKRAAAIVEAWYPGEQGGAAIADVLFGDYNPAGRAPYTYHNSVDELPPFDDYEIYNGRTYMYFKGKPLYPFGYGLSYTTFAYSGISVKPRGIGDDRSMLVSFSVKNTGGMDGDEVAQVYARRVGAPEAESWPIRKLVAFKRINVKKGKTVKISLEFNPADLARWDEAAHKFVFHPGKYEVQIGASSADIRLKKTITLVQ